MFKYHSLRKLESASGPLRVVEKKTCLLVTVHFIYPGGQVLRDLSRLTDLIPKAFSYFKLVKLKYLQVFLEVCYPTWI